MSEFKEEKKNSSLDILVQGAIKVIKHPANTKHKEVTIVINNCALLIYKCSSIKIPAQVIENTLTMARKHFPESEINLIYNTLGPIFSITCKGKTERRGEDVYDEKLGVKIATVKSKAKIYKISRILCFHIAWQLAKASCAIYDLGMLYEDNTAKEKEYLEKEKYLNNNK